MTDHQLPDTQQVTNALNDGTQAAQTGDKAAAQKMFDSVVELYESGQNGGASRADADMVALTERYHANNILPGVNIVGVENGQIVLEDAETGEQNAVDSEGFTEIALAPNKASFGDGSIEVTMDTGTGKTQVTYAPAGQDAQTFRAGEGGVRDIDVASDGSVTVINDDLSSTVYSGQGTVRQYAPGVNDAGEPVATAGNPNQMTSMSWLEGTGDDASRVTAEFNHAEGTVTMGDLEGQALNMGADGTFSFQNGNNGTVTVTPEGAMIRSGLQGGTGWMETTVQRTDGSTASLYDHPTDNEPAIFEVNGEGVGEFTSVKPLPNGDFRVERPDGTVDMYKADGSKVQSAPLDPNNESSALVPMQVTYPNGTGRRFSYDADGQVTKVEDLDSDGNVTENGTFNTGDDGTARVDADGTYRADKANEPASVWNTDGSRSYLDADVATSIESTPDRRTTQADGAEINFDDQNRVSSTKGPGGATSVTYEEGSDDPNSISTTYSTDGSQLKLTRNGDSWSAATAPKGGEFGESVPVDNVQLDAAGNYTYEQDGLKRTVTAEGGGTIEHPNGTKTSTIYELDGSRTIVRDMGGDNVEQFNEGPDGTWTRSETGLEENGAMGEPIADVTVNADGSVSYTLTPEGGEARQITASPDGSETTKITSPDGLIVQSVTHDKDMQETARSVARQVGDNTEELTVADGEATLNVYATDNPDEPLEIKDVSADANGDYAYTMPDDEERVQVSNEGRNRISGEPGEDGEFSRVNSTQWTEEDGTTSGRAFEYDKETGNLVGMTGTGTADSQTWEVIDEGKEVNTHFRRDGDELVAKVTVGTDGSVKQAYRDENGQVQVEIQRADGTVEKRAGEVLENQPIGNGDRTATIFEDGSMAYTVIDGADADGMNAILKDVFISQYGREPKDWDEVIAFRESLRVPQESGIDNVDLIYGGNVLVIKGSSAQGEISLEEPESDSAEVAESEEEQEAAALPDEEDAVA